MDIDSALFAHNKALLFGGPVGIRSFDALEMAIAKPKNMFFYGVGNKIPDRIQLAMAYASGIIRLHPFVDGNKRTGLIVMELFLKLNGYEFVGNDDIAEAFVNVAAMPNIRSDQAEGLEATLRGHTLKVTPIRR